MGWPRVSLLRDSLTFFIPNLQIIQSPKCFNFTVLIFFCLKVSIKELWLFTVCGNITVMRNDCLYTSLNLSSCSFQLSSHEIELQLLLFAKNQQSPKPSRKNNTHQSTEYHCQTQWYRTCLPMAHKYLHTILSGV